MAAIEITVPETFGMIVIPLKFTQSICADLLYMSIVMYESALSLIYSFEMMVPVVLAS